MARPTERSRRRARPRPRSDAGPIALYGLHPVREALRARRRRLFRLQLRRGSRRGELEELAELAAEAGVPVVEAAPETLEALAGGGPSQGAVLEAGPLPELSLEELAARGATPRMLVALDGVEDPRNVGAIVRVAEAAGASGLILMRRHAPPLSPALARASAGAIEWLPTGRVPNLGRALNSLKDKGFWIFGGDPAAPLDAFELPSRLVAGDRVLVLGAEGRGLRRGTGQRVDHWVRIPMRGEVGSLNVSSAAAVLLFELARRDRRGDSGGS